MSDVLEKKAKTLSELLWENELEWNEWLRMGVTEPKAVQLSSKFQEKWVRLEDAEAELKRQTDTELERQDLAYQELVAKAERDCYKCIKEERQKLDFLIRVMKRWLKVYEDSKKEGWYRDIGGLIPKFEELLEK